MLQSYGFSYVGLTQWALCDGDDRPDAMVVGLSSRRFDESIIYVGGGFAMETSVTWNLALHLQTRPRLEQLWGMLTAARTVRRASLTVPPEDAADVAVGRRTPLHHEWMRHDAPGDPWWDARRFAGDPSRIPPVTVLAGWQDLFLLGGFADFAALRSAGATVRLIAGDWTHHGDEAGIVAVRELLRQFADPDAIAQAPGIVATPSGAPGPAVTAPSWPPTDAVRSWHLADGGVLLDEPSDDERIVSYRYDPADPTPQAGGRSLNPFQAGRRDQRPRERRDDVLVWTGQPSAAPMVLAGDASVELTVTSTNPRVDLFLRLCDVDAAGRSHSVADGYLRLPAPDGEATTPRRVVVPLGPVGHRLAAGHRLRLQVSSGAHPLHLRNPGTADPTHDASRLVASTQTVVVGGPDGAVLRAGVG